MCLSTVYKSDGSERTKLAEYVSTVRSEGDKITLTDIMGLETVVYGAMKSVDLVKNEILIEGTKQ
jgi:predicted RNA-binding protein